MKKQNQLDGGDKKIDYVPETNDNTTPIVLTSKQEVADELKMSLHQFQQLVKRYPFSSTGVPGKIMGRWRITKGDAWNWFRHVQKQELRHPDARRTRPEEAPALSEIHGRS